MRSCNDASMDSKPIYESAFQTASKLGVPEAWLKREADAGHIPCVRAGRRRMFNLDAVARALGARQEGAVRNATR